MLVPNRTDEIFDILKSGKFLCENYPEPTHRKLYSIVYDNYDSLYEYFSYIGYILNKEQDYFYFSKEENKFQIENKLNNIIKFIDLLDFILEYQNDFSVGYKVSPSQLLASINENTILKNKLSKLDKRDVTLYQKCKKILDDFVNKGVMAIENEEEEMYLTLSSFNYIQKFCESIKEVTND